MALVLGSLATTYYAGQDLTLSHYDAKAHLVVARRIFDSLTPGWRQIGAVWLPLPHVLNALPVQVDAWYRTGLSGVVISMLSFASAAGALCWLVGSLSGSRSAAVAALAVFVYQPDLLYLQSTPMTEPLLLGLVFFAVADTHAWVASGSGRLPLRLGVALAAAAWTRYEAWPAIAALTVLAGVAWWRGGVALVDAVRRMVALAAWPAGAALLFLVNSRITVGAWFVSSGFFVPDPALLHRPWHDVIDRKSVV